MRVLIISIITLLLTSSCSDQARIDQYEKQLKESNKVLEGVIDNTMSLYNLALSENPAKAEHWVKKAHAYFDTCQKIIEIWPISNSEADSLIYSLEKLQSTDINKSNCPNISHSTPSSNFEVFKNKILINLHCYLSHLYRNIGHSDKWLVSYIEPYKIKIGDTTLVMLEGNIYSPAPDFVISFDNPKPIKFNTSTSLGFFFLPKNYKDSVITGQVEVFEGDFSQNVRYYPFKVDTGYRNTGANDWYYAPPKSATRNPNKTDL